MVSAVSTCCLECQEDVEVDSAATGLQQELTVQRLCRTRWPALAANSASGLPLVLSALSQTMAARECLPSGPITRMTLRRACIRCIICHMFPLQMCLAHGNLLHSSEQLNAHISTPIPLLQAAIDSCPVSCIHWVQHEELAALEWVMQVHMSARPNVGMMMCGQVRHAVLMAGTCLACAPQDRCVSRPDDTAWYKLSIALPSLPLMLTPDLVQGGSVDDVFSATYTYMKKREAK